MAKTTTFKSLFALLLLALGLQVSFAQTTVWTETYSDGPTATAQWQSGGINGGTLSWEWTTDLDAGMWNGPTTSLPTGSTGYFWFDSDGNGQFAHDVTLTGTGNPASCTGKTNLHLKFFTFFRTFTGDDIGRVGISTDGGNTFTYHNVPEFDALVSEESYEGAIDIAIPEADNQAQVVVQFRWEGAFEYYWKVDDLEIYEYATPVHDVTFQVDASLLTVDPSGMFLSGSFNGFSNLAMTDQGSGLWSATVALEEGSNHQYKFKNGAAAEPGQAACGVSDGAGGFNRTVTVGSEDATLPAVCYNLCTSCVVPCDLNPNKIVCDNFDTYTTTQRLAQQSPTNWTTWSGGGFGGAEDGIISIEQANSGANSMKIVAVAAGGPQDVVLKLQNKTTGRYELKWMCYVPAAKQGYYNIQNVVPIGAGAWNLDVFFEADNGGHIQIGAGASLATFSYPNGEWFEVRHIIDLDNNLLTLWIDGQFVHKMAYPNNLGGIDFFGINGTHQFYIDDVEYIQLPALVYNVDVCDAAVDITLFFGQATTQTTGLYDNTNATVAPTDPAVDCWGETAGVDILNGTMWYTFVGDGNKYHIETVECNATNYIGTDQQDPGDTQMLIYAGDNCSDLTEVACNDDLYPSGTPDWRAAVDLETVAGQNYYMLIDGFEFQGVVAQGEFCIEISQLPTVTCDDAAVGTYEVNSPYLCIDAQLADLISIDPASYVIPNNGPVFGLAWAITSAPIPANTWPNTVPGLLVGSTGFLPDPFIVGYVNDGTPFAFNVYYITPIVLGGGTDTDLSNGPTLFDTDPGNGCFFLGESTLMYFLPLTDDITATAVPGPGSATVTPGGGIAAITSDPSSYSYNWSNGATTQNLSNVPVGTYTCTVSDKCSEPAIVTVVITIPSGTEDPASIQSFVVSPNPTTGLVAVNLALATAAEVRIEVLNTLGQTLQTLNAGKLSKLSQNVDLSNMAQGSYFLRVTVDGETAIRRVAVQR